ncbi:MAG: extracellular solute-binding protein [Clostridiales bacterium]|nr:extracellular solute-binding protein [Clostridiales bacterium]
MRLKSISRCFAILFVFVILISVNASCISSNKLKESSPSSSALELSTGPVSDQFFEAVDLDTQISKRTIISGTLSDSYAILVMHGDNEDVSICKYNYDGTIESEFFLDIPIGYQFGSCKCLFDNKTLLIIEIENKCFDVYFIDVEKRNLQKSVHFENPAAEELASYIGFSGLKDNTIYMENLTEQGSELQGFDMSSTKLVFQSDAIHDIDDVEFFWIGEELYAANIRMPKRLYSFDSKGKMTNKNVDVDNFPFDVFFFENQRQFMIDSDGLWYVNEQGEIVNYLLWSNSERDAVAMIHDTRFAVTDSLSSVLVYSETGVAQILSPGKNKHEKKQVLKLACISDSQNEKLLWAIQQFNKSNDQYVVELVDYVNFPDESDYLTEDGFVDYPSLCKAARELLWKDVFSGNGPDMLVNVSGSSSDIVFEYLETGGYVIDLLPFWNSESDEWRKQFVSSAFLKIEQEGHLMSVPTRCCLDTTVIDGGCGLDAQSNYADIIAYMESHPEIRFLDWVTKEEFLASMLSVNMDAFVRKDTNTADFDQQSFRDLLKVCNEYCMTEKDKEKDVDAFLYLYTPLYDRDGSEFLYFKYGSFYEEGRDRNYEILGYPMNNGSFGYISISDTLSVTQSCKDQAGAWSFIKFMLSKDVQSYDTDRGELPSSLPVRWDSIDDVLDYYWHPKLHSDYWDEDYGDGPSTQIGYSDEEIQSLKDYLASLNHIYYPDSKIINLVMEEVAPYFSSQKSLDDVVKTINNRVQVVLNERGKTSG